jgi:hypothetical protein
VRTHCPRLLEETHNWFRDYKIPDGKGKNEFAFNGEYRDRSFALSIINETHELWHKLVTGTVANNKGISLANRLDENIHNITSEVEEKLPTKAISISDPAPVDLSVHKLVYAKSN